MKKNITNSEFFAEHTFSAIKQNYEIWADKNSPDSDTVSFDEWLNMKYVPPMKYKWVCSSDDGYLADSKEDYLRTFNTQEEAYESMKMAVFNNIDLYADYNEVIEDCCAYNDTTLTKTPYDMGVYCNIEFHPHKIILIRNGCIYKYEIKEI